LLALGSLHLIIEGAFTCHELAHMTSARWMQLPMLLRWLFILSSLLGITTIALAFWAKLYPLMATTISVALYVLFAVLMGMMIQRFNIPDPPHPEGMPSGPQMCLIVLIGVVIKSLHAAIKQHQTMKQTGH
jgi:hypothetical protein